MKVVTFGEIMLRLQPEGYYRFVQADSFSATYSGAEANVAISLANYGDDAFFVTKLPPHEIGQCAINALRKYGVHTDFIKRGGKRIGIYYNEKGASQRSSKCIYDRAYSAIAEASLDDFDWNTIFKDCKWFHITGITPAIGGNLPQICMQACECAKKMGVTISCDLNYRSKLWTKEQAQKTMKDICKYVDLCVANEEDAKDVFGIEAIGSDVEGGVLNKDGYVSVARQLAEQLNFKQVAITLRTSINASHNKWAGLFYDGSNFYYSREYDIASIVDRIGSGDSFTASLIHSLLHGKDAQSALDFAVAASCLKHSIEGDFNMVSEEEVERLASGTGSGRILR